MAVTVGADLASTVFLLREHSAWAVSLYIALRCGA